ncbi:unnamed protein product, partial [Heterotrigona itama]
ASCLRNVSLEVVPEVVQRGQKVILRCHYDLEKAPLYSLKWYRGRHEFYRYTPSEEPATKVFNITVDDMFRKVLPSSVPEKSTPVMDDSCSSLQICKIRRKSFYGHRFM